MIPKPSDFDMCTQEGKLNILRWCCISMIILGLSIMLMRDDDLLLLWCVGVLIMAFIGSVVISKKLRK